MFLNIITPCSRPENLIKISKSINIPTENYRWLVIFDMDEIPNEDLIPKNCEVYTHRNPDSVAGHSQRNFAIDLIKEGYLYSNDDDTELHPNLWENIKNLNCDFISFRQVEKGGKFRLEGNLIRVNHIDSHNFIVSMGVVGNTRYIEGRYDADGVFAEECYKKCKSTCHIKKTLSIYNSLRP